MSDRAGGSSPERASALALELRTSLGKLKRRLGGQAGREDLTSSQAAVLLRLEKDGAATVSKLARAEAMRPQSMSAVIAPLKAAGLVSGTPDPNDGRQTLFALTKLCRKRIEKRRAAKQDWLTGTIQTRLSAQEQERLAAALRSLAKLVAE